MITKFEDDPPLSSKSQGDSQNPHDLLNFVNKLQISDGDWPDAPSMVDNHPHVLEFKLGSCLLGGVRHHSKTVTKVSVIGGGDLGMASLMSILSKVIYVVFHWLFYSLFSWNVFEFFCAHCPFPPFLSSVKSISSFSLTLPTAPPGAAVRTLKFSVSPTLRCSEVRSHDEMIQPCGHRARPWPLL